jgi:hypothetical protein
MTLLRTQGIADARALDDVISDGGARRPACALAEPTNPTPSAAMLPRRARLPFEIAGNRWLEAWTCESS